MANDLRNLIICADCVNPVLNEEHLEWCAVPPVFNPDYRMSPEYQQEMLILEPASRWPHIRMDN